MASTSIPQNASCFVPGSQRVLKTLPEPKPHTLQSLLCAGCSNAPPPEGVSSGGAQEATRPGHAHAVAQPAGPQHGLDKVLVGVRQDPLPNRGGRGRGSLSNSARGRSAARAGAVVSLHRCQGGGQSAARAAVSPPPTPPLSLSRTARSRGQAGRHWGHSTTAVLKHRVTQQAAARRLCVRARE